MDRQYHRLVVSVNGTAGDNRIIALAGLVADKQAVRLTLIYVVEVIQSMPLDAELLTEVAQGEAVLNRAEAAARQLAIKSDQIATELLQARSAGAAIVDEAIERNADAIVMAAANRHKHGRMSLGDTVSYVLKNAPCEVIVLRQAQESGEPAWQ